MIDNAHTRKETADAVLAEGSPSRPSELCGCISLRFPKTCQKLGSEIARADVIGFRWAPCLQQMVMSMRAVEDRNASCPPTSLTTDRIDWIERHEGPKMELRIQGWAAYGRDC